MNDPNENKETTQSSEELHHEAVIGVFDDAKVALSAANEMRKNGLTVQRVTRSSVQEGDDILARLVYEDVDSVAAEGIAKGIATGGGIGAVTGLVLMAIPGVGIWAPIGGLFGGGLIGGMAGIDEPVRAIKQPEIEEYYQMVKNGKSLLVLVGDESERLRYAKRLEELGASNTIQHPPTGHLVTDHTNDDS